MIRSQIRPEPRRIVALALSSGGRWLASGTSEGRICIWDRERDDAPEEIRDAHGFLNDLRFSPDDRHLAVANRDLSLVAVGQRGSAQALRDDEANYGNVRFTSDGKAVLVTTGRETIEVIDIATRSTRLKACCSTVYGEAGFSPDEAAIFSAGHWPRVWDGRTGHLLARLTESREFHAFGPVTLDPPRGLVYMGSQDGRICAWDLKTRRLRTISPPKSGYVNTITVMGKAGWVAYAALGGAVRIWNPETREGRDVPNARTTSNLLFDASSNLVLLGTEAGDVESWDLVHGKIRTRLALPRR